MTMTTLDKAVPADPNTGPDGPRRVLRVVLVVPAFPPDGSESARRAAALAQHLHRRRGIDVTVVTTDSDGQLDAEELVAGHRVVRESGPAGVARRIARRTWDVVDVHVDGTALPILAVTAARRAGLPLVVTFHSGAGTALGRAAVRGLPGRATRLVVDGDVDVVAASTGLPAARFETAPDWDAVVKIYRDVWGR